MIETASLIQSETIYNIQIYLFLNCLTVRDIQVENLTSVPSTNVYGRLFLLFYYIVLYAPMNSVLPIHCQHISTYPLIQLSIIGTASTPNQRASNHKFKYINPTRNFTNASLLSSSLINTCRLCQSKFSSPWHPPLQKAPSHLHTNIDFKYLLTSIWNTYHHHHHRH